MQSPTTSNFQTFLSVINKDSRSKRRLRPKTVILLQWTKTVYFNLFILNYWTICSFKLCCLACNGQHNNNTTLCEIRGEGVHKTPPAPKLINELSGMFIILRLKDLGGDFRWIRNCNHLPENWGFMEGGGG